MNAKLIMWILGFLWGGGHGGKSNIPHVLRHSDSISTQNWLDIISTLDLLC